MVFGLSFDLRAFTVESQDLLNKLRLGIVCSNIQITITGRLACSLLVLRSLNTVSGCSVVRHLNGLLTHEVGALRSKAHRHLLSCIWILFDFLRFVLFLLFSASEDILLLGSDWLSLMDLWLLNLLLMWRLLILSSHISGIRVVRVVLGGRGCRSWGLFLLNWGLLRLD